MLNATCYNMSATPLQHSGLQSRIVFGILRGMSAKEQVPCPPEVSADLIIDTIPDGLIVLDAHCRMQRWNKAMEQIAGYSEQEMIGKPCGVLHFQDANSGNTMDMERQCLTSGQVDSERMKEIECTLQARNGETVPVRKYGRVLLDAAGGAIGILMVITDLRPLRRLQDRLSSLELSSLDITPPGRLLGTSPAMQAVYHRIRLTANSDVTVLIEGETGTGKERVAEAIHECSTRSDSPLVKVNCSALSENLLESELFGHVKGAFTGAVKDSPGRIERAEGGTLFLDEIGDISPLIQLKLLRLLQEHEYERVGDTTTRKTNVRFIAATHRNLRERVDQGLFREDFYYRIRVYAIEAPALRNHKTDIPQLCQTFIARLNRQTGRNVRRISDGVYHCFQDYCWPGNVRQLENAIEHAFVTCQTDTLEMNDLPEEIRSAHLRAMECSNRTGSSKRNVDRHLPSPITRDILENMLTECHGNQSETARRLGVDRTTVWRKLKQWK